LQLEAMSAELETYFNPWLLVNVTRTQR